jgi:hypothetical protein
MIVVSVHPSWDYHILCRDLPYRPFAFPQGENYSTNIYFLPIRTLSLSYLKLILVVRLLVRCVTEFNKDCPHQLFAGL